jgi:hypothetical protein
MMININANNPLLAQVHSYSTPGADRNAVQRLVPAPTSSSDTQRFGLTRPGINLAPPYDFESIARPVTNRNGTTASPSSGPSANSSPNPSACPAPSSNTSRPRDINSWLIQRQSPRPFTIN